MNKTAIVILNWNGIDYLKKFLPTIIKYSSNSKTIIAVADNGSTDGSCDWIAKTHKDVILIQLDRNYGFAEGYNKALSQIKATYYILINSDIEVTDGWIEPLVDQMDNNPDLAACQPKILSYNNKELFEYAGAAGGFIDKYGYPFCRGRLFDIVEKDNGQYNNTTDVFWSSGACMIMRSAAWEKCGGFDPAFFAHMEEIDLCWRFNKAGYRVSFLSGSVVYHVGGGSLPYNSPFKTYLNFRNSLFLLYKNLPDSKLRKVLFVRKLLDGLAAIKFLVNGNSGSCRAVWKAHIDYYKSTGDLKLKRKMIRNMDRKKSSENILNKSVVFEFYVRGKKTYEDLMADN
jgi:GT2 family glycosyltransferase